MKHYQFIVAYDGTDYHGWQAQKAVPSIAQTLQDAFLNVFNHTIHIKGASRTDAGVHALGQVCSFTTNLSIEPAIMESAWNNRLPCGIVIRSLRQIDGAASIFENIDHKIYYYHFFTERPLPFICRYGWYPMRSVDIEKLKKALAIFKGTHDFRSFRSSEDLRENTVRTIDAIELEYVQTFGAYRITVIGKTFLRHMIRRMVGACLEVASRPDLPISLLHEVLAEKNPEQILPNAPAKGLLLYKIVYQNT